MDSWNLQAGEIKRAATISLVTLYRDERVSVPGTMFNAVLNCLQEL
jgi:hypothetical protein